MKLLMSDKKNNINHWKNYLVGASKLFPPGDPIQMERSQKQQKFLVEIMNLFSSTN